MHVVVCCCRRKKKVYFNALTFPHFLFCDASAVIISHCVFVGFFGIFMFLYYCGHYLWLQHSYWLTTSQQTQLGKCRYLFFVFVLILYCECCNNFNKCKYTLISFTYLLSSLHHHQFLDI